MNWLDGVIIFALALSAFWSFRQGFILELFYFLAVVIGIFAASVFYQLSAPFFQLFIRGEDMVNIFSFAAVFILTATVLYLAGLFTHKFIHFIKLGFFDRMLGAFVGLFRALMTVVIVLVILVATAGQPVPAYLENSLFCRPLVSASKSTMDSVPLVFNNVKDDYGEQLEEWLASVRGEQRQ